ncbi:MAG: TetR-like C-terminal domain-containing protein [Planctomycetota bacterium]|nr:TetR-like C-terminal domain-containing protein [Planctomycetota bacterium]
MNAESPATQNAIRPFNTTPAKGRPRDEQAHQLILETTRKLAAEKQRYSEISIEAVSRGAHVAKTTIYRWWKTKNALVREACFAGRLSTPRTGSLLGDVRNLIAQEVAIIQGPITRGVLAGFATDFIEASAKGPTPKRFLHSVLDEIFEDAERRGEDVSALDACEITNQIEMVLFYKYVFQGEPITPNVVDELLEQVMPAA